MSSEKRFTIKFANYENKNNHTEYTILIKDSNNETWTIKARYSQLRHLNRSLREMVSSEVSLPEFPPKKFFGNLDPSFISQRQKALENYFNNLLGNEQTRKLDPLIEFIYNSPRLSSNSSIIRSPESDKSHKAATSSSVIDRSASGQLKNPDKLNPQMSNTIGLHLIIESINKKFFDLSYTLSPPEEEEAKKKKALYEKIKIEIAGMNMGTSLPMGKEDNLVSVKNDTLIAENTDLVRELFETTSNIRRELDQLTLQFTSKEIVHTLAASSG